MTRYYSERPAGSLAPLPVTVATGPRGDFGSALSLPPLPAILRGPRLSPARHQPQPASEPQQTSSTAEQRRAVSCRAKGDGRPSRCGVLLCVATALLCLVAAAGGVTFYVLRHKADAANGPNALRGTFVNPVIPGNFADPFVLAR